MKKPKRIIINATQLALAAELGAERAAQLEYQRQIEAQFPGCVVTVNFGSAISFAEITWPEWEIDGIPVVYEQ